MLDVLHAIFSRNKPLARQHSCTTKLEAYFACVRSDLAEEEQEILSWAWWSLSWIALS
jgi:hypothetical protein